MGITLAVWAKGLEFEVWLYGGIASALLTGLHGAFRDRSEFRVEGL